MTKKKAKEPRVTASSLKVPAELKIDQRRYLAKRIACVFNGKIREVEHLLNYSDHARHIETKLQERRGELGLQYLASCEAGTVKVPHGCTVSSKERGRRTEVYELVVLSQAEEAKVCTHNQDMAPVWRDALLMLQRDRQMIADKVLIFRDASAVDDLTRCEALDYVILAEVERKAKQKQLN